MKVLLSKINNLSKKNKVLFLSISVLLVVSLLTGISYAYYLFTAKQGGNNLVSTACFKLSFEDKNDITLENAYPIEESEGENLRPYEFTIKNICSLAANYQVNLETLNESSLDTLYLRSKLDESPSKILGSLNYVETYVNDNVKESRKLDDGVILPNEEVSYKLRVWVDKNSTVEQSADKIWNGKVTVISTLNTNPYSHVITMHPGSGYLKSNTINAIPGREIGKLESPTWEGYNFIGWFSDNEFKNGVSSDTEVTPDLNDIYANYTEGTYKLEIDPNNGLYDGSSGIQETNITYKDVYNIKSITRYGWTFKGWDVEGKETKVSNDNTTLTMGVQDSKITANWEINKHKLTIVDSYTCDTEVVLEYLQEYTLCEPQRDNYTFAGWENTTNIIGLKYTMQNDDETIRATWVPINYGYTVKHYLMNVDGKGFTIKSTENYFGNYGEEKTAPRNTYTGFDMPASQKITIQESNNIVEYYYPRKTYKLTIDLDNGTAIGTPENVYYEAEYSLPTPTKTGYNFKGWNKTLTSSGKFKMPAEDTTIKALYDPITYKINFDVNGGDALSQVEKNVIYDQEYGPLPTPNRTGYTFEGWFIGDTRITSDATVKITKNEIAKAQWSAKTYNIQLEPNGGTIDKNSIEVVFDESIGILPKPVKAGYRFMGWFTDKALTKEINNNDILNEEIIKLYAKYTLESYTLTIDSNGGSYSGDTSPQVMYTAVYNLGTITKLGNSFKGWRVVVGNDSTIGTTVNGSVVTMGKGPSTVQAQWEELEYDLNLQLDGGKYNDSTNPAPIKITYNQTAPLAIPTRDGYEFLRWEKVSGSGVLVSDNLYQIGAGDATIKAIWAPKNYGYITYHRQQNESRTDYVKVDSDTEKKEAAYDTEVTPAVKTYSGYISPSSKTIRIQVESDNNNPQNNIVTYDYNRATYNFTLTKCDGTTSQKSLYYGQETQIEVLSTVGYNLSFNPVNGTYDSNTRIFKQGIGDSSLTAVCNPKTYTVYFQVNGGNALPSSSDHISVTYNSTYGTLPTPTRTGYTFAGWYTESTGGTRILDSTTVQITSDQNLYARWEGIKSTVTFDAQGGTSSASSIQVTYGQTYGTLPTASKSGATFEGWYTEVSGGTKIESTTTVSIISSQTLYAHWKETEYKYLKCDSHYSYSNNQVPSNYDDSPYDPSFRMIFEDGELIKYDAVCSRGFNSKVMCVEFDFWKSVVGNNIDSEENGDKVINALKSIMDDTYYPDSKCKNNTYYVTCSHGEPIYYVYSNGNVVFGNQNGSISLRLYSDSVSCYP